MLELLRKLMLAGLGTLDLTEEKARAIFEDLVRRGELSDTEARELTSGWVKRAKEQRAKLQQQIDEAIRAAFGRLDVASRGDVKLLAERVAELERKVEQLLAQGTR